MGKVGDTGNGTRERDVEEALDTMSQWWVDLPVAMGTGHDDGLLG
jgi:hypothetical protein